MDEYNIQIGKRLRLIREIINEGGKLSSEQFAYLVNESKDKIINYELGRSAIPVKLIYELYKRGINPTFIITGNEDIFASNENGLRLKSSIEEKLNNSNLKIEEKARLKAALISGKEFIRISDSIMEYKVAAGKIK
jgi:transcriptional regulator with XRE-family HTH domain